MKNANFLNLLSSTNIFRFVPECILLSLSNIWIQVRFTVLLVSMKWMSSERKHRMLVWLIVGFYSVGVVEKFPHYKHQNISDFLPISLIILNDFNGVFIDLQTIIFLWSLLIVNITFHPMTPMVSIYPFNPNSLSTDFTFYKKCNMMLLFRI